MLACAMCCTRACISIKGCRSSFTSSLCVDELEVKICLSSESCASTSHAPRHACPRAVTVVAPTVTRVAAGAAYALCA
eukprot:3041051-Pleurochrysis_carterae.AAC.1